MRKILNAFTISWILMNLFLFLAMLQTWNFVGAIFGSIFLGIIMGVGGIMFISEGFYSKGSFNITAPTINPEDAISLLTGAFAILTSYGYISGSQFYITHFSGVQGGVFAFMFVYLVIQGFKNRLVR